jgi:hypothetical protein
MRVVLGSGLGLMVTVIVFIGGGVIAAVEAIFGSGTTNTALCVPAGAPANGDTYQPDQIANAATIVAVGKQMQVPKQGWIVALAAAMQESGLRNLHSGDRDSLGLFQQRPSQGWGSAEQITNPTYAATQFYRSLLHVPDWQQMSINDAAQAVERSGFPNAYAQHESAARALANTVSGATCSAPGPAIGRRYCDDIRIPMADPLPANNSACASHGRPNAWPDKTATSTGLDPDLHISAAPRTMPGQQQP